MNKKVTALLLAALIGFGAACKKKDNSDDDTLLFLLLYTAYLTSGNCATVTKSATNSYSASMSGVPRGGCDLNTLLGSSRTAALAVVVSFYNNVIAKLDAAGSDCSTNSTGLKTTRDALTTTTVCASGLGIAASNCVDDAAFETYVGTLTGTAAGTARRYTVVGNAVTEGTVNTTSTMTTAGVPTGAQASARIISVDENFTNTAHAVANTACKAALKTAFPILNSVVNTGTAANITAPVLTSASCVYGTSSTTTATNGTCPTLNEVF